MRRLRVVAVPLLVACAALAACGGGGGSGSSGGGGGIPSTPVPTASPTVAPSATPTPRVTVAGRAVDESGAGIAGATVSFGTGFALVPGGAITGIVATATTDATGAFTASLAPGSATFVQVRLLRPCERAQDGLDRGEHHARGVDAAVTERG